MIKKRTQPQTVLSQIVFDAASSRPIVAEALSLLRIPNLRWVPSKPGRPALGSDAQYFAQCKRVAQDESVPPALRLMCVEVVAMECLRLAGLEEAKESLRAQGVELNGTAA